MALQRDDVRTVRGLKAALRNVENNCTDEKLLAEAEEETRKSQKEVEIRQRELEQAFKDGDSEDIEKRQLKLNEAIDELDEHRQELNRLLDSSL
ncbi:DUF1090 family protein [Marinobacter alkaliphilus]|uniref:DUF1090 family protein n=1 Tax=Marinobacter alkaliphilus TaxID=254719 RepID=UPI003D80D5B6|nr:DUF1090 family protein [Marinobacter alkaliphilus]